MRLITCSPFVLISFLPAARDELNLAPSDVLEALNRLLDDNKELLIPETGEIVRPAPGFALFATQNPPGAYGGRKMLSRAFRNRFLELNICDLPLDEIEEIVTASCGIAPKFSKMLVKTMEELRVRSLKHFYCLLLYYLRF